VAPLGVEPAAIIPFEPALFGTAANNGQMIAEADPKSPLAGSFDLLAQIITGRAEIKVEKKKSPFDILSRIRPKKG
jgi:pilus assembly protein CpaE